jgi:hypothetical protein
MWQAITFRRLTVTHWTDAAVPANNKQKAMSVHPHRTGTHMNNGHVFMIYKKSLQKNKQAKCFFFDHAKKKKEEKI